MKLTTEQLNILSKWEGHFHCAINADWCRNPGEASARKIHEIYKQATGDNRRVCYTCQHSLLSLMRDCGRLYFADKAENEARKEVSSTKAEEIPIKKVKVKTTAKKTAKKTAKTKN